MLIVCFVVGLKVKIGEKDEKKRTKNGCLFMGKT